MEKLQSFLLPQRDTPATQSAARAKWPTVRQGASGWNTAAMQSPTCRWLHRSGHWTSKHLGTHLHRRPQSFFA